jgi:hypothetical protein
MIRGNVCLVAAALYFSVVGTLAGCAGQPPAAPDAAKAQKMGYTLIEKEGQRLFCRTETVTGLRAMKQTTCLTAAQLEQEETAMRASMGGAMQNVPGARNGNR